MRAAPTSLQPSPEAARPAHYTSSPHRPWPPPLGSKFRTVHAYAKLVAFGVLHDSPNIAILLFARRCAPATFLHNGCAEGDEAFHLGPHLFHAWRVRIQVKPVLDDLAFGYFREYQARESWDAGFDAGKLLGYCDYVASKRYLILIFRQMLDFCPKCSGRELGLLLGVGTIKA